MKLRIVIVALCHVAACAPVVEREQRRCELSQVGAGAAIDVGAHIYSARVVEDFGRLRLLVSIQDVGRTAVMMFSSADGISFEGDGSMSFSAVGDSDWTHDFDVIRHGDAWVMVYVHTSVGTQSQATDLRLTTSPDLETWSDAELVFRGLAERDETEVRRPRLVRDPSGGLGLYYSARQRSASTFEGDTAVLSYAVSDEGRMWTPRAVVDPLPRDGRCWQLVEVARPACTDLLGERVALIASPASCTGRDDLPPDELTVFAGDVGEPLTEQETIDATGIASALTASGRFEARFDSGGSVLHPVLTAED